MEWISVEERLPEKYETILLFRPEKGAEKDQIWCGWRIRHIGGQPAYRTDTEDRLDGITHWMPLPEPPKETEGG